MRTFSKRFGSMLVLLMAIAALTVAPRSAAAQCTGDCHPVQGCIYSGPDTGMYCENLPGGFCQLYQCGPMQKFSGAAQTSLSWTTELAPLTLAKPDWAAKASAAPPPWCAASARRSSPSTLHRYSGY